MSFRFNTNVIHSVYILHSFHILSHWLVTSSPFSRKNLALHPPQKSETQIASGNDGQFVTKQGLATHAACGTPGGQRVAIGD